MRPSDLDVLAEARRLHVSGREAVNAGRPAESASLLREGLSILGWGGTAVMPSLPEAAVVVARLLMTLAVAEAEQGDTELGMSLLDEASRYVAAEDNGILLQQRALILRMSGRLSESLDFFNMAESSLVQHGHLSVLEMLYLNRGALHGSEGRFSVAIRDFSASYELAHRLGDDLTAGKALQARGIVEKLLGDVPAALVSLESARGVFEQRAPEMVPYLLAAQGHVLHAAGLIHEASLRLNEAIAGMERLQQHYSLAIAEVFRAQLSLELGNSAKAIEEAKAGAERAYRQGDIGVAGWAELIENLALFESGHRSVEFAEACLALAGRRRDVGRVGDADLAAMLASRVFVALSASRRAVQAARTAGRAKARDEISVRIARYIARAELAAKGGDISGALDSARTGLAVLHDFRSRLGSVELQVGTASLGRELARIGVGQALASGRPSTMLSWSERSRAQAFRLPPIRPVEDNETADLLAQIRQLRNGIRKDELAGRPTKEDKARCSKLERQLRERSWTTSGPGESIREYSTARIRSELSVRDSALASFFAHDGRMHVLVLANGTLRHFPLGPSSEVEETARRLVADLDALTGRNLPSRMEQSIRASIQHQTDSLSTSLFTEVMPLIGDRELVIVPTQMLSSLPWGLLAPLRGRPVTVAPSAAVWVAAVTREFPSGGTPFLAAGPDLALAESELSEIALHYPKSTVLVGERATAAATLSALDGAPIAHLAAHGHHEPDNVLFSRLDFADGPLMAYDIARLANPPRHVTLSACDVGRSVVAVGDETLGFTAALLYAGTSTVVSSVARVAHDVAAQVMVDYHGKLAAGVPPARALAEANAKHDLAPFVLFGAG